MLFDLVFDCGGVRGVAFIGALEALTKGGHEFDRLLGTSIGGFVAALLATGHDVHSIRDLVFDEQSGGLSIAGVLAPFPPFTRQEISASATRKLLREVDSSLIPNAIEETVDELVAQALMNRTRFYELFSVLERMGVRQDGQFLGWLDEVLNANSTAIDWASMSLGELYRSSGRSLTVIATDITTASMLVLNHSTAPDLPLKWAVRMTAGVPYLFPPIAWKSEWGLYRDRRLQDHLVVDGGIMSQFPIELFLSQQEEIQELMGKPRAGTNVLGLLLDEFKPVPGLNHPATGQQLYSHITSLSEDSSTSDHVVATEKRLDAIPGIKLSRLLFDTMLANSSRSTISPLESHIIRLPVMGIDAFAYAAAPQQLLPVINAAYNVTEDFLHGWEEDPQKLLSQFEQQYAKLAAERLVVMGDYYSIGNITNSEGVVIGEDGSVEIKS